MRYLTLLIIATCTSVLVSMCQNSKEQIPTEMISIQEAKELASQYGVSDLITDANSSLVTQSSREQLKSYFQRMKVSREHAIQDSLFFKNQREIRSYTDMDRLIDGIPGMREREQKEFGDPKKYEEHLAYMRSIDWHIYYQDHGSYGTLIWVKPEDDHGSQVGERLDTKPR